MHQGGGGFGGLRGFAGFCNYSVVVPVGLVVFINAGEDEFWKALFASEKSPFSFEYNAGQGIMANVVLRADLLIAFNGLVVALLPFR